MQSLNDVIVSLRDYSFVATVGGNLTITGSAANIIVSEKVARLDPSSAIDFFKHYRVCFWITLLSCCIGTVLITLTSMAESQTTLVW
jgi:Na+/H+ antiporter NhaD/arsenite permease-like protein